MRCDVSKVQRHDSSSGFCVPVKGLIVPLAFNTLYISGPASLCNALLSRGMFRRLRKAGT